MAKTEIFSDYEEFFAREDKTINGVSPEFAEEHPDWKEVNSTNVGCWCCRDCKDCRWCIDCGDCVECTGCNRCKNCKGCKDCGGCINCKGCSRCMLCDGCLNCEWCAFCLDCDGYRYRKYDCPAIGRIGLDMSKEELEQYGY